METYVFSVNSVVEMERVEFTIVANNLVDAVTYAKLINPDAVYSRTRFKSDPPDLRDMFDQNE